MIYIDFFGGLHGNFLCYCINALDPSTQQIDIFTKFGTSHNPYKKTLAEVSHYSANKEPIPTNNVISIRANLDDCLLVNLLCFERAGDYNFDLNNFHIDLYNKIHNTNFYEIADLLEKSYNINVKKVKDIPKHILREYLKFMFHDYSKNPLLQNVFKQCYSFPVYDFYVRDFYDFDKFIANIENIKKYFQLTWEIDRQFYFKTWQKFMEKITQPLKETYSYKVLEAVKNRIDIPVEFNILQESWLNARLENLYKKEMPFLQEEYFKTTGQIIEYLDKAVE